ncbi:unnamed protein product [Danaus chrysippus]|uniref:(African queen) hypothetical protein n=1 Tax=Danaus chrysippus TaxID=151541 RepID=A0A8J2R2M0_9NEOP|nr:unnamed protein product [Danaus chrysippus]
MHYRMPGNTKETKMKHNPPLAHLISFHSDAARVLRPANILDFSLKHKGHVVFLTQNSLDLGLLKVMKQRNSALAGDCIIPKLNQPQFCLEEDYMYA